MDKIAIIGIQGAGKSTFAHKLGKILSREVVYLDKEYYLPTWEKKYSKEEWINFQRDLVSKNQWIIDGNYQSTLTIRLDAADTIVFFDFPKWLCLYRALKRAFTQENIFDKAEGTKEKVSVGLLKYIISYPKKQTREMLTKYDKNKNVFIVRSNEDIESILKKFKN